MGNCVNKLKECSSLVLPERNAEFLVNECQQTNHFYNSGIKALKEQYS